MALINSTEDYDSVMIAEDDVVDYEAALYPAFRSGWGDNRWDAEKFNFVVPIFDIDAAFESEGFAGWESDSIIDFCCHMRYWDIIAAQADEF
jgi:hypothetical protein